MIEYHRAGSGVGRGMGSREPAHVQWKAATLLSSPLFSPLTLEPSKGYQSFSKGVQAFLHTDPQIDFASSSPAPQRYLYYVARGNSSFAQSRKLVSVALDAGQMCIDQNEDFSRLLDRKKKKKKKGLTTPATLGILTSISCPSPGQGTSASRALTALWNWARGQKA